MPGKKNSKSKPAIPVDTVRHKDKRTNIPTEELRDFVAEDEQHPYTVRYPRNEDKQQLALFADFNGLPDEFDQRVDFYHHDGNLLHRRRRTLREAEAGLARRDRRSRLVRPLLDHQPPLCRPRHRQNRRQGHQSLSRIIHDAGNCVTPCRSYVRQNVGATRGHVPRSGERSYTSVNNPGYGDEVLRVYDM
jgi:hypothetical protein